MKFLRNSLYVSLAGFAALAASCAEQTFESYEKYENIALKAWIEQNRPDLIDNFQEEGKYYVEVVDKGELDKDPIGKEDTWVRFSFTGRSLSGNIALTRNGEDALQEGTFTRYTRYVPFYRFCGEKNATLLEGTYLAMRNTLKVDGEDFQMRYGSRVRLYMPSSIVGSGGLEGSGGYEGQYSLSAKRPMIVEMMITDTVRNPLQREGSNVDAYCLDNGGLRIYSKPKKDDKSLRAGEAVEDKEGMPTDPKSERHPYNVPERWVSACDSVPQLYVNLHYKPSETFDFKEPYFVATNIPGGGIYTFPKQDSEKADTVMALSRMQTLNRDIADALVKRFYPDADKQYVGIKDLNADSVKLDGTAKIWYIGRFLDGFIFDTNIDEVKQIIYGKVDSKGTAFSYTPESGGLIKAFYYVVPNLQYGQWATFITTSTNGYGAAGKQGATSASSSGSTSSSYYDYLNYQNMMNNYYGNSYYNGYYNGYYGGGYGGLGYMGGYYGDLGGTAETTPTKTSVSTEVPSFTPLIFQLYIEPKSK